MSDMRGWSDDERRARALAASEITTEAITVITIEGEPEVESEQTPLPRHAT
ncbi:hypothetical protein [Leifsonia kafniensis]|uniref:hypothetical protein n=1 Tax=Leifsonia kafniensis TaxID=475957 RepID=UPI0031F0F85F